MNENKKSEERKSQIRSGYYDAFRIIVAVLLINILLSINAGLLMEVDSVSNLSLLEIFICYFLGAMLIGGLLRRWWPCAILISLFSSYLFFGGAKLCA